MPPSTIWCARAARAATGWLKKTAAVFASYTRARRWGHLRQWLRRHRHRDGGGGGASCWPLAQGAALAFPLQPWEGDGFVHQQLGMPPGFLAAVRFSGNDGDRPAELTLEMIPAPVGTLRRQDP